jgi:16S rRNA processing protein RimM
LTEGGRPVSLLEVGRVVKAHGLGGEVVVDLFTPVGSRLDPGAVLHADGGDLRVASSRAFGTRFLVHFEGVRDRPGAEALRGVTLRAEPVDVAGTLWVHELVGAEVVDQHGAVLGRVVAVEPNPASDLLVLEGGGLIPLRFVTGHRPGERIEVDVPEGLVG